MPKLSKNVTRLNKPTKANTPTKANKPTKANTPTKANKPTKASKPIAADKPEDLTEPQTPIVKPSGFSLDKFKSKHTATIANVGTLPTALPHHSASEAKDFVRLHPDEETIGRRNCASSMCRSKGGRSATRCT